ncbi:MAG: aminotransferase class V-fold PLP-dependent enzyme [Chitinophagaceae bacterium]|nr:aminotransferase class V-fold PLP-dependent enzyme [Chitinophagaceae bacterium]MBK8607449.1 aminotransferase class V-fold PLP-dependent enzyme [Chitinophagaceae bacterium]MBP6234288.1 aminotransferase class V-fold PLP-dependent enzyme [Chitinophagaceae bacterium]MBP6477832.1 aminotransferase class V-fold PLP-dependent enzyme [Chitinophagaceae bacterium]MBP7315420.1 aminotransferase class V-fold PLP-dependent enzyme [Chitinophagaceae bacterium]
MPASNRRKFLQRAGIFSATAFLSSIGQPAWSRNLSTVLKEAEGISPDDLATEEDFWYHIQQSFTVSPSLINLNNGGVSPAPKTVQDAMKRYYDYSNEAPSYYMWRILDQGREPLRNNLANIAGCSPEEIAINRNSSEGLETIIFGLQLKAGDEVVAALQDYPNMINAYKQREMRDGIKMKWISLELPSEDEDYLVRQYVSAFTPKTKVVHITHIINWNGQILPVKKIANEAHKRGIEVIVDGAHSFAHFNFKIPDLDCDYFAASLHKWLYAPIGTGVLYVKKEKIKTIYPLFATSENPLKDDIRKFENLGTRPFFIEQAITKAIEFHEMIGIERKEKRLHYLKNYWMEKVKDIPGVKLNTSLHPKWGCAIGNVGIEGKKPNELDSFLMTNYKIHTVAITWENIVGVRITPNVYTTTKNLDVLVEGIKAFVKN